MQVEHIMPFFLYQRTNRYSEQKK